MAAYAALTSLKYIVDQLRDHPSPPISLDEQQVESLTEKVVFLQEFLESYRPPVANIIEAADPLEMRIADAAYAAEDVIESHIVDMIQLRRSTTTSTTTTTQPKLDSGAETSTSAGSNKQKKPTVSFNNFRFLMEHIKKMYSKYDPVLQGMQRVIKEMDLIKKEVMKIKKEKTIIIEADEVQRKVPASGGSSSRSSIMVGMDDVLLEILDKLTGGYNNRHVIPIVGMGGIGVSRRLYFATCLRPRSRSIGDAAYAVEDVIDSYIVDNIHLAAAATHSNPDEYDQEEAETAVEEISFIRFYQDLEKVIEEMELIKKEVMEMVEPQPQRSASAHAAGFRPSGPNERKSEMVGFDNVLLQLLDWLTRGNLQLLDFGDY